MEARGREARGREKWVIFGVVRRRGKEEGRQVRRRRQDGCDGEIGSLEGKDRGGEIPERKVAMVRRERRSGGDGEDGSGFCRGGRAVEEVEEDERWFWRQWGENAELGREMVREEISPEEKLGMAGDGGGGGDDGGAAVWRRQQRRRQRRRPEAAAAAA